MSDSGTCGYCGAYIALTNSIKEEKDALIELHNLILSAPLEKRVEIIRNGFLPDHVSVLIDAGMRIAQRIDTSDATDELNLAAIGRLEAIMLKLRFSENSHEVRLALKEFGRKLGRQKRYNDFLNFLSGSVIVALLAGIGYGIFRLIRWLN
jgi:hypothetical protein